MSKKKFINPAHLRTGSQEEVYKQIEKEGLCPFCLGNFERYNVGPAIKDNKSWTLVKSKWPYKNTKSHLIFILKPHIEDLGKLKPKMWNDLFDIAKWTMKKYKMRGGALAMRFGDSSLTGATVHHLHAHIMEPKRTNGKRAATAVNFPIG